MKKISRKHKSKAPSGYGRLVALSRAASPALGAMYYVCAVAALLLVMTAVIVAFVNVPADEMLLPPFMIAERGAVENSAAGGAAESVRGYNIMVGNGIRLYAARESVELSDIKTVIYAGVMIAVTTLLAAAPVFRFLSRLLRNIGFMAPLEPKNARYVSYIGLTVIVGWSAVLLVSRFYNYMLVKTFVEGGENMELSLGFNPSGLAVGLLIMLVGAVYSYAITAASPGGGKSGGRDGVEPYSGGN